MKWDGFTEEDRQAQLKGFDTTIGNTGYLREAYHGGPYVTHFLVSEAFDFNEDGKIDYDKLTEEEQEDYGYVHIPAATLRKRLPKAIQIFRKRVREVYNHKQPLKKDDPQLLTWTAFVELAERLEKEGKNPRIYASY